MKLMKGTLDGSLDEQAAYIERPNEEAIKEDTINVEKRPKNPSVSTKTFL